jgi:hypothetical protein
MRLQKVRVNRKIPHRLTCTLLLFSAVLISSCGGGGTSVESIPDVGQANGATDSGSDTGSNAGTDTGAATSGGAETTGSESTDGGSTTASEGTDSGATDGNSESTDSGSTDGTTTGETTDNSSGGTTGSGTTTGSGSTDSGSAEGGDDTTSDNTGEEDSSQTAMAGSVSTYPQMQNDDATLFSDAAIDSVFDDTADAVTSISREDMVPASALVSLFLLTDVNFENPIATVATDSTGNYTITAQDVRLFLSDRSIIGESETEDGVIVAFRSLGQLQVRALIVRPDDNGVNQAMAIQSIADPSSVDENGDPKPVAVDPIVHRVVSTILKQIKDAIGSLTELGLSSTVVDALAKSVIQTVASEISRVVEEADSSIIEIPEGQSFADVVAQQEEQLELDVPADDIATLSAVLDGSSQNDEEQFSRLKSTLAAADRVVLDEDSTLGASLGSEEQGLLSGLDAIFSDTITDEVDDAIAEAETAGSFEGLFRSREGGPSAAELLAAAENRKKSQLKGNLQRFFLSLGLGVLVDENESADAGVIAVSLPAESHIPKGWLPGGTGFKDRGIRLFKIGSGELDAGSLYTADPLAELAVLDVSGQAQAPLYYAPALSGELEELLAGNPIDALQETIDAAFQAVTEASTAPTDSDVELVERVRLLNQLRQRLDNAAWVSESVISKLVENRETDISIKRIAAVVAENFQWSNEEVNMTPEGFPIYSGRTGPLAGSKSTVTASELFKPLGFTLGESALSTVKALTQRIDFYAQYAPDAIQNAIQQAEFKSRSTSFDLLESLLSIYPENKDGYRDLIIPSGNEKSMSPDYEADRNRIARGLASALPSSLFGQQLTSESSVSIRTALFFIDYLLNNKYLIDPTRGYYTQISIVDASNQEHRRFVPNYNNLKSLEPVGQVSLSRMMSTLLNITAINDGDFFDIAVNASAQSLQNLPQLPEFREQNIEDFQDQLGGQSATVDLSCTVERFDGQDPDSADTASNLELTVYSVNYNQSTGEFRKGDALNTVVTSTLEEGSAVVRRTYRVEGLSSRNQDDSFGRDYVIRFEMDNYANPLPELYFWVDGYVPEINLCDTQYPLFIGPDEKFDPTPGLGIASDQSRPNFDGTDEEEGIDVSNFETPGAPVYLTASEELAGKGELDLFFRSNADGYRIDAAGGKVGFAPLYGAYEDGQLDVTLDASENVEPLLGLQSIMGSNIRNVISEVLANESLLESSIALVFNPETFNYNQLYFMRDAGGSFWVVELRYLDQFEQYEGNTQAFLDLGFAKINSLGDVNAPNVDFDATFSDSGNDGDNHSTEIRHAYMLYGDWLVLENPANFTGPDMLPSQQVSFDGSEELYAQLGTAIDGLFVRFAGNHFDERINSYEDFDIEFGNPPDYSSIPARLEAGRDGITMVKLVFNESDKLYTLSPNLDDAAPYIINLQHNDIIAFFDAQAEDPETPAYLARVQRYLPASDVFANFEMALEVVKFYESDDDNDIGRVVCFADGTTACLDNFPLLVSSDDSANPIGVVFDADFDGIPALFDPNDADPNVPGTIVFDVGAGSPGTASNKSVNMYLMADPSVGTASRTLVVETNGVYPGEIESLKLTSELFGADSTSQTIFVCTPPSETATGEYKDFECAARQVDAGIVVRLLSRTGEKVSFALDIPEDVVSVLDDYVEFDVEMLFSAPTDLQGNVFQCGTESCPGMPASKSHMSIDISNDIPFLAGVSVEIGNEVARSLETLVTLDVTHDINLRGIPVPNALEYELQLFCAGVQTDDFYQYEENMQFYSPGTDHNGEPAGPDFYMSVPWIADRECDLIVKAFLQNDAGDFIGASILRYEGMQMVGGNQDSTGGYIDNEFALSTGQVLCMTQDPEFGKIVVGIEGCTAENTLFTVDDLIEAETKSVAVTLGSRVMSASSEGEQASVVEGSLFPGATIEFDIVDNGEGSFLSCGVISTNQDNATCAPELENVALTNLLTVSSDGSTLFLTEQFANGFRLEGPTSSTGEILLDFSGHYVLVSAENDEDLLNIDIAAYNYDSYLPDGSDGPNDPTGNDSTANQSDDSQPKNNADPSEGTEATFEDNETPFDENSPSGSPAAQVYVRITRASEESEYERGNDSPSVGYNVPGIAELQLDDNLALVVDLHDIRDSVLHASWFDVAPSLPLVGEHDLDGDGVVDLQVSEELGQWKFVFDSHVEGVDHYTALGLQVLDRDATDNFVEFVEQYGDSGEFSIAFPGNNMYLGYELEGPGEGSIVLY